MSKDENRDKLPDADLYTAKYTVPQDESAEEFVGEKSDWSEDISQEKSGTLKEGC